MDNRPWAALLVFLSLFFAFVAWAELAQARIRPNWKVRYVEDLEPMHLGVISKGIGPDAMLYLLASGVERVREKVEGEVGARAIEALISTFHPDTRKEIAEDSFLSRMRRRDWPGILLRPLVQKRILVILWDEAHGASVSRYSDFPRRRRDIEAFTFAVGLDVENVGITKRDLDFLEASWRARPRH